MIVFFTPSGVKSVTDNFPDYKQGKTLFACWGDAAAKEMEARNYRLDLKAPTAEATSMPAALDIFLEGKVEKREE
jgi:uroporphyrinogen-III synthase